jgi:hypothetical protein
MPLIEVKLLSLPNKTSKVHPAPTKGAKEM